VLKCLINDGTILFIEYMDYGYFNKVNGKAGTNVTIITTVCLYGIDHYLNGNKHLM